jgi:DNA mismatch repair protein MutS2
MKGIVHDVSNTGATVFVEPWSTVELGNDVRELALQEKHEVEKILAGLSVRVGSYELEITRNIELTADIDLVLAKARYARKANATEAHLSTFRDGAKGQFSGVLRLVEARHPLLGEKAVPLSVELGRDFNILVITGPNTGGKTVAMKTVGLLSMMTLAGLPVPAAAESSIPVFDGIFADIGDEQSIEQTISSFSWHVGNIVRIVDQATNHSLVLLDELGTNTDPTEGSALARSVLLHFLVKGAMAVATTHFSELKAFAHSTPGMQNASLDFDPVTLMPAYHLTVGVPGGSNALATASRLGLMQEIVDRAREMQGKGTREMEGLIADLVAERKKIESLRIELQREKAEADKRNTELNEGLQRLRAEERHIIREARDKVSREAAELHKLIREVEAELRKEKTRERIEQAKKALAASHEQLNSEAWKTSKEEMSEDSCIKAGDAVWLKEADIRANVLSVLEDAGQVEVQAGATRLRISLDSVEKVVPASAVTVARPIPVIRQPSKRKVSLELDIRGKRAEEIEPALDSYINDASLANMSEVRIIHGIGTGVVRQITRDFLAAHPLVKSFRSGGRNEGGDGATVVSL